MCIVFVKGGVIYYYPKCTYRCCKLVGHPVRHYIGGSMLGLRNSRDHASTETMPATVNGTQQLDQLHTNTLVKVGPLDNVNSVANVISRNPAPAASPTRPSSETYRIIKP